MPTLFLWILLVTGALKKVQGTNALAQHCSGYRLDWKFIKLVRARRRDSSVKVSAGVEPTGILGAKCDVQAPFVGIEVVNRMDTYTDAYTLVVVLCKNRRN